MPPPLRRGRSRARVQEMPREASPQPANRRGRPRQVQRADSPVRPRDDRAQEPRQRERSPLVRQVDPPPQEQNRSPDRRPSTSGAPDEGLFAYLIELRDELETLKKRVNIQGDLMDPLHLTVTPDIRSKICSGKFVDFSLLLSKNYQSLEDDSQKKLQGYQDEEGNFTFKAVKPKKSTLTIDQWSSAFNTYMSVYLTVHPDDLQGMLSYAELIRGAARDHPDSVAWRLYDEHFRSKKASDPLRPWGMIDNQLWLAMFCKPLKSSNDNKKPEKSEKSGKSDSKEAGKDCYYFNKPPKGCFRQKCLYKHVCSGCGRSGHPVYECYKSKNKNKNEYQKEQNTQNADTKEVKNSKFSQLNNRPFPGGNRG